MAHFPNPERPIRERLFDPLFEVEVDRLGRSAPKIYPLYLKLVQTAGQPQKFELVSTKWEKTPLDRIAQCFAPPTSPDLSSPALTIGEQISQEVHRYDIDKRMAATFNQDDKKKLGEFVGVMVNYLVSYSDTLIFKIRVILARIFPCIFASPQPALLERLSAMAKIADYIEEQYGPFPQVARENFPASPTTPEPTPYDEFKALAYRCDPRLLPRNAAQVSTTAQVNLVLQPPQNGVAAHVSTTTYN